jgi:hypothetical protein
MNGPFIAIIIRYAEFLFFAEDHWSYGGNKAVYFPTILLARQKLIYFYSKTNIAYNWNEVCQHIKKLDYELKIYNAHHFMDLINSNLYFMPRR